MPYTEHFATYEPTRAEIERTRGPLLLEFGAPWCGYCQAAQPVIQIAFANHRDVPHLKIEDGKDRPLGRSFGVKLWPTLIYLKDGEEVARLVRPTDARAIADAFYLMNEQRSDAGAA